MIFKVQLPVETNEPEPFALAYNADRSQQYHLPITPELTALFPKKTADWERKYKLFVHGKLRRDGAFVIDGKAPWQDW